MSKYHQCVPDYRAEKCSTSTGVFTSCHSKYCCRRKKRWNDVLWIDDEWWCFCLLSRRACLFPPLLHCSASKLWLRRYSGMGLVLFFRCNLKTFFRILCTQRGQNSLKNALSLSSQFKRTSLEEFEPVVSWSPLNKTLLTWINQKLHCICGKVWQYFYPYSECQVFIWKTLVFNSCKRGFNLGKFVR